MNAIRKRGINMKEKHYELSISVFTVTTVLLFGFFMLTSSQAFADNSHKGIYNKKEWQKPAFETLKFSQTLGGNKPQWYESVTHGPNAGGMS